MSAVKLKLMLVVLQITVMSSLLFGTQNTPVIRAAIDVGAAGLRLQVAEIDQKITPQTPKL